MNASKGIVYLCGCAVHERTPDKEIVDSLDLPELYSLAVRHSLASIVGLVLQRADVHDPKFDMAVDSAYRKTIILEAEKDAVFSRLDQAGIWHMALKGTILRNWYPAFGMRESADCDILFDRTYEEQVRDIMQDLGYSVESYGRGHHDVYFKKPVTNMQMHVELFGTGFEERLNCYYANVKDRLVRLEGFEYAFRPEDFYLYMLAHNHRDYSTGGTGLRSVLDTYVFLRKFDGSLDWNYIGQEAEKLEISDFEKENGELALRIFGEGELPEEDEELFRYLVGSGTYGTIRNKVNNKVNRGGGGWKGKLRYVRDRLILPMDVVEAAFPFFYRHKILLPLLPVYRTWKGLTKNSVKLKQEWEAFRD